MLKMIRHIVRWLKPVRPSMEDIGDGWKCDPLSHPDVRAMSMRDLGDLPFDPARFC